MTTQDPVDAVAAARQALFGRWLSTERASDLADRLTVRDAVGDERRVCMECAHLKQGFVCGNWRLAGYLRPEAALPDVLCHCHGFDLAVPLGRAEGGRQALLEQGESK